MFRWKYFLVNLAVTVFVPAAADLQADMPPVGPITEAVDTQQYEQVLYVNSTFDSRSEPDGTRQNPYRRLDQAIGQAEPPDGKQRIAVFVAAGTYTSQRPLRMKSRVDLYGGFDVRDWSRDIVEHRTLITPQGHHSTILGADDARFDGFVITAAQSRGLGGAFLCDGHSPWITNNYIEENRTVRDPKTIATTTLREHGNSGAAICCVRASPLVRNNQIARNKTDFGDGGALFCSAKSHPTIEGNLFCGNESGLVDPDTRSSNGGAIACTHYSHPVIRGNVFLGNHAGGRGDGGAIYGEYFCEPKIDGNIFIGNSAEDDGAAVYFMAAARPHLQHNLFVGNGPGGGAIRLSKNGLAILEANTIVGNQSGGVICRAASLVSRNNVICENQGSGIVGLSSVISSQNDTICRQAGHGFATDGGGARIVNAIIVANQAGQVQLATNDIWVRYCVLAGQDENEPKGVAALATTSDLSLDRVIAMDQPPRFRDDGWTASLRLASYSPDRLTTEVEFTSALPGGARLIGRPIRCGGRWTVIHGVAANQLSLWGDLEKEFATGGVADCYVPLTYHLDRDSPGIDQGGSLGAPETDHDGQPRPLSTAASDKVDIGADEFFPVDDL